MDRALQRAIQMAAREAGETILEEWTQPKQVTYKGRIDLVTKTDVRVERQLKESLGRIIPQANFLSEETSAQGQLEEQTWVIDPIDGTTTYVHGIPFVAISIALWEKGKPLFGLVYLPVLQELFHACAGQGAFLNDQKIHVSDQENLEKSLVATGFPYAIKEEIDSVMWSMKNVLLAAQGVRRAGAAAVDLAYTACGRVDGFYEIGLKPWDTAAGLLLVTEAGGHVSSYDSNGVYELGGREILATNGRIHQKLAQCIRS